MSSEACSEGHETSASGSQGDAFAGAGAVDGAATGARQLVGGGAGVVDVAGLAGGHAHELERLLRAREAVGLLGEAVGERVVALGGGLAGAVEGVLGLGRVVFDGLG